CTILGLATSRRGWPCTVIWGSCPLTTGEYGSMQTLPATATPHPHQQPQPAPPPTANPTAAPALTGPNNSPHPAPSRPPKARRLGSGSKLLVALVLLLLVGGGSFAAWYFLGTKNGPRPDLLLHTVKPEKLQVTIVERGALESAENAEIVCRVKARTQGSTV